MKSEFIIFFLRLLSPFTSAAVSSRVRQASGDVTSIGAGVSVVTGSADFLFCADGVSALDADSCLGVSTFGVALLVTLPSTPLIDLPAFATGLTSVLIVGLNFG